MNTIEKFYADAKRIIKHDRANNVAGYDGTRASQSVSKHFISLYRDLGELPYSIAKYWEEKYIKTAVNINEEPSEKNITWLASLIALLEGDFYQNASESEKEALSKEDWEELCMLVNSEAGDIPLDLLTSLMAVFTEKKVL